MLINITVTSGWPRLEESSSRIRLLHIYVHGIRRKDRKIVLSAFACAKLKLNCVRVTLFNVWFMSGENFEGWNAAPILCVVTQFHELNDVFSTAVTSRSTTETWSSKETVTLGWKSIPHTGPHFPYLAPWFAVDLSLFRIKNRIEFHCAKWMNFCSHSSYDVCVQMASVRRNSVTAARWRCMTYDVMQYKNRYVAVLRIKFNWSKSSFFQSLSLSMYALYFLSLPSIFSIFVTFLVSYFLFIHIFFSACYMILQKKKNRTFQL